MRDEARKIMYIHGILGHTTHEELIEEIKKIYKYDYMRKKND